MAYGHAERALATIRLLEAETAALLNSLPELDAEQAAWLDEVNGSGAHSARWPGTSGTSVSYEVSERRPTLSGARHATFD